MLTQSCSCVGINFINDSIPVINFYFIVIMGISESISFYWQVAKLSIQSHVVSEYTRMIILGKEQSGPQEVTIY